MHVLEQFPGLLVRRLELSPALVRWVAVVGVTEVLKALPLWKLVAILAQHLAPRRREPPQAAHRASRWVEVELQCASCDRAHLAHTIDPTADHSEAGHARASAGLRDAIT